MRVRCGTQGHVAEPRGPAQRAYVARFIYIIYLLHIYVKGVFSRKRAPFRGVLLHTSRG